MDWLHIAESIEGFDWDTGNQAKNWQKHSVTMTECEEVFFNQPLLIMSDNNHSQSEVRHHALGRSNADRKLFLVFTIREKLIRIISARNMSRRERVHYEKENAKV